MRDFRTEAPRNPFRPGARFVLFAILFSLSAAAVLASYGRVMLAKNPESLRSSRTGVERGPILDRNGRILAMQTKLGNITAWRPEIRDIDATASTLGKLLDLDPVELAARIRSSSADFLYIKKKVEQSTVNAVKASISDGVLTGIGVEDVVGRVYPEKNLAGQLVGFVGDDTIGLAGIEYAFQAELAAAHESQNGRVRYGDQVFLTIDANAQYILEGIARKSLTDNDAESALFIAMDPRTGDILAYVGLPGYDPNDIRASTDLERSDRIAVYAYEPGSVFKIFSLAGLMELGAIDHHSTFECDGAYEKTTASGERIVIKCLGVHGTVGPEEIIKYSCNAGAAYASDRASNTDFHRTLKAFGFGEKTGIGVPGETPGFLREVERWSLRSRQTIAIGQEIAVSALQIVQAATAIANDGVLVRPRIISRILGPDGTVKTTPETATERILSPLNARHMRDYMLAASSEAGTGRRAGVEDMRLAVKTGTAQLIDATTGGYSKTDFAASCIAMFPAENPSLILYHVLIRPKGESYLGGRIAAPPIREAAEALGDYFGILRGRNPVATHSGSVAIQRNVEITLGDTMPDLRGLPKRRLLPLLNDGNPPVEILGDGWVRRQSPPPGAPLTPDTRIRLELE